MTITYLTGDATQPIKKPALIMHVCNDIGGWGRGFVLALSKRWPEPERAYRALSERRLGSVGYTVVERDADGVHVVVANMIAQYDVQPMIAAAAEAGRGHVVPPIRYEALADCLQDIQRYTRHFLKWTGDISIHCPRIGCGLAGGSWSVVEPLIEFYLKDREVYVYDLPTPPAR